MGAVIVLLGASMCAIGSPTDSCTEFTSDHVSHLFAAPAGMAWFLILWCAVASSVLAIVVFERRYPTADVLAHHTRILDASTGSNPHVSDLRLAPPWLVNQEGFRTTALACLKCDPMHDSH